MEVVDAGGETKFLRRRSLHVKKLFTNDLSLHPVWEVETLSTFLRNFLDDTLRTV